MKKYLFLLVFLFWTQAGLAYVFNQTKGGTPVHWPSSSSIVDIYVNPQNTRGLSESTIQSVATSSVAEWNTVTSINIRKNVSSVKNQIGLNEMYFSTDQTIFGSGVLGVTQVSFKEIDGEILEADVLINDNSNLEINDSLGMLYLGNVMTHELGHFLGLGHGQVFGSTMFYAVSRGQHVIADDDRAGLYSIYPNNNANLGSITGTVVGGKSLITIFGTHVQAFSVKTGKIMGAAISDPDGHFNINGLPRNDQYLIYTSPIVQLGLPTNYAGVKNDFCESSKNYRGSFFQSCGASAEGFPQAVSLNTATQDIGLVTVRCGLDSPPDYFQTKGMVQSNFDVNSYSTNDSGGTFVGFFSTAEMLSGSANDYFHLNYSRIQDWNQFSTSPNIYVELKIINQSLYSLFKPVITISRSSGTTPISSVYTTENSGRLILDTVVHIPINRALSSDNDFLISVKPDDMTAFFSSGIQLTRSDFFPSYFNFQDPLYFYVTMATLTVRNPDGSYSQIASKSDVLSDNNYCPDAVNTYKLSNYATKGITSGNGRKQALGCGTVDFDGGTGGGPGGFFVGLIFCYIVSIIASRYSKLA